MTHARGLAGEEIPEGEDRLLTAPNLITLVRLLCIPLFLWLLFGAENYLGAAVLQGLLGATDWVDGWVARHFGQVSNFGKMFDPTVDRLLLIVAGSVLLGARRMDVTWVGKCGAFAMMTAFPAFLASADPSLAGTAWETLFLVVAWGAAVPGLVWSMMAFVGYVREAPRALREGREMRAQLTQG